MRRRTLLAARFVIDNGYAISYCFNVSGLSAKSNDYCAAERFWLFGRRREKKLPYIFASRFLASSTMGSCALETFIARKLL
jgi:hypothetical protein